MKRTIYLKVLSLFILTFLSITIIGCSPSNKEILLTTNVAEDMKIQENSILQSLEEGNNFLQEKNFTEAKKSYEKAISCDKNNLDTYVEIRDKYLDANRLDDAYYFIKLSIDNNVDRDNMIAALNDIQSKFDTTTINNTININTNYTLPEEVPISINGESNKVKIQWENKNVNTSTLGTFSFNGISDEYGRKVLLNLTVRKPIKEKKIGFITNFYEKNGEAYITFDEAQFFIDTETDKTATNEALKDGRNIHDGGFSEDGLIYNSYYIKNSSTATKEYKLSKSTKFLLCRFIVDKNSDISANTAQPTSVDYTTFSKYIATARGYSHQPSHALLFWIDTEDNIVNNIDMQYAP
ncbi:Ig-like domain-containing protein [Clostridium sp. LP20]|uniref:Ig-like domain-containing protein n=1 Tax=Clostridium sp. LP20 TaxID=3418665 RepID=UPI003EE68B5F